MSSCKCQILHANRRQRLSNLQSQYINCGRNIITRIPCQVYSNIAKQCASEASSIEVLARGCISGSSWLGQLTIVTSTQTARCISSILPCCAFDNFYTLLRQLSYHVSLRQMWNTLVKAYAWAWTMVTAFPRSNGMKRNVSKEKISRRFSQSYWKMTKTDISLHLSKANVHTCLFMHLNNG